MEALTGVSILIIAASVIALMMIFTVPIGLYITAYFSGVKVRILKI